MRLYFIIVLISLLHISCSNNSTPKKATTIEKSKEQIDYFISINLAKPEGWFVESEINLRDNLERFDLEAHKVQELMRTNKGSIPVAIYTKYQRNNHEGIIPTINIVLRPNMYKTPVEFNMAMQQSIVEMGQLMPNYKVIKDPHDVVIGKRKGIHFLASFDMKVGTEVTSLRSWNYGIPVGQHFYQINFSDIDGDDCSLVYQKFIDNITFGS